MAWKEMIFQDWEGVVRTILVGVLAYATLVIFLRISGKRTLAKLNAFDLVVTVARSARPFRRSSSRNPSLLSRAQLPWRY